jgi:sugar lactone lactonase YvrE
MKLASLIFFCASDFVIAQSGQYFITTVVGSGTRDFNGDGGPATTAALSYPAGVAIDAVGNLYIADSYNNRIRKVTPAGTITTMAGSGPSYPGGGSSGDGGLASGRPIVSTCRSGH